MNSSIPAHSPNQCLIEDSRLLSVISELFTQPNDALHCMIQQAGSGDWNSASSIAAVLSAFGTLIAAFFAFKSSSAAERTVSEMQDGRLQTFRPILYLTPYTERLDITWNPKENATPRFKASVLRQDGREYQQILIQLNNYGQAPALDLRAEWSMNFDPASESVLLESLKNLPEGISIEVKDGRLCFLQNNGKTGSPSSSFWSCANKAEVNYGACAPNSFITLAAPLSLQSSLFLQAVQLAEKGILSRHTVGTGWVFVPIPITIRVKYNTALEKNLSIDLRVLVKFVASQFVLLDKPHGTLADTTKWDELRISAMVESA